MSWRCHACGVEHSETPTCFGYEAPWRLLVPDSEFTQRVQLSPDVCIVDEAIFFVRGQVQIPILGNSEPFQLSVWSSLSERSFEHMGERWESPERGTDPPYFGWLSTNIAVYSFNNHLKLSIQSRAPGETPLFTLEPSDHPLSINQHHGISTKRWHELIHLLMHSQSPDIIVPERSTEKKVIPLSWIRRLFGA